MTILEKPVCPDCGRPVKVIDKVIGLPYWIVECWDKKCGFRGFLWRGEKEAA